MNKIINRTVFLFIPNYVYSSDCLRTLFAVSLADKMQVVIFAPMEVITYLESKHKTPRMIFIPWKVQFPRFWNLFGKLLRYSMIRKFDFEPVVKRNREKGMRDWRRRFLRFFSYFFPSRFLDPLIFTKLETRFLPQSMLFKNYLEKYRPSLIVTPTPGFTHLDAEAIVLGKKYGLETAAINFSWDNLHNGGVHLRYPDYLVVWNDIIKRIAIDEFGYPENRVFVSGIMRFDNYFKDENLLLTREEFLVSKGLNPREKVILITTVTKGNYPKEHSLLDDLLRAREEGLFRGYPNIYVRLHPKEEIKRFTSFSQRGLKNLIIEKAGHQRSFEGASAIEMDEEDIINLKQTLKYCDVLINYASTITLEAFVFDKPTVNIAYPEKYNKAYSFRHYKPLVDIRAVVLANSFDELILKTNEYLLDPTRDNLARKKILQQFVPFRDGSSYVRNVSFIEKIMKKI